MRRQIHSKMSPNSRVSAVLPCTWGPTTASDGTKAKHFRVINELTDEGSGVRGFAAATSFMRCTGLRVFCTAICLKPASRNAAASSFTKSRSTGHSSSQELQGRTEGAVSLLEQRRAAVARQLRRLAIELTDIDRQLDEIEQSER